MGQEESESVLRLRSANQSRRLRSSLLARVRARTVSRACWKWQARARI